MTASVANPENQNRLTPAHDKAQILADALPYIRSFAGKVVVVKYGGNAMDDPALADLFAQDIVLMHLVGLQPVVVHGGGPQISELMRRRGKAPEFIDGLRVTDRETIDIAREALVEGVNREIVDALNRFGTYATGLSGEDNNLLRVTTRDSKLGFVGDVQAVDTTALNKALSDDLIPVIATIGSDASGQAHNVNADSAAAAIAEAMNAERLIYLTDVAGIYGEFGQENTLISQIDCAGLEEMFKENKIGEGMIPKVLSCIEALKSGVGRAHILDGRIPHVLLLELFTPEGVGTVIDK
ncbi:MAG: acetylglutamate kinase [Acidimicrobiia bacterium]|jgi:acetylglutamate kinase|nr:acetylglutamate kinase [Acidimicrobiia bacterium]